MHSYRLDTQIERIVAKPAHRERMLTDSFEPTSMTPEQFGAFIRSETVTWAKVMKVSGAKAE